LNTNDNYAIIFSYMAESLQNLDRWHGGYPGPHHLSDLDGLIEDAQNPGVAELKNTAQVATERWVGDQFAGVLLCGQPGTGKTHAAIGMARALHEIGAEVHYQYVPAIADPALKSVHGWSGIRYNSSGANIFPKDYAAPATRNPRTVLILDDIIPGKRAESCMAIEAAAQFGGLVIATTNMTNVFEFVAPDVPGRASDERIVDVLENLSDPEQAKQYAQRREEAAQAISASLRDRIASAFKIIEFTGESQRAAQSLWV
jgi:hypothetical protein